MPRWLKVGIAVSLGVFVSAYGGWHLPPMCESDKCASYYKVYWLVAFAGVLLIVVSLFLGTTETFFGDQEKVKRREW